MRMKIRMGMGTRKRRIMNSEVVYESGDASKWEGVWRLL